MSGHFLDIPNEKIVEDFKRLNIRPTAGRYFREENRYSTEGCCPISCQLISGGFISIGQLYSILSDRELLLESMARDAWPDLNEKDDEFTNLTLFLHGFDSVTIERQSPYLKKGRELRALLFGKE